MDVDGVRLCIRAGCARFRGSAEHPGQSILRAAYGRKVYHCAIYLYCFLG